MGHHTIFSVVVLLSVAGFSTAELEPSNLLKSSTSLSEPYEIVAKQGKSLFSNLGNVPARNCGGSGRLLQWRNEACLTPLLGGACAYPAGQQQRAEITFVPSSSTESLSARTTVTDNQGEKFTWQNPNISTGGPVQAEKEYSFKTAVVVGPQLRGRMLTVQMQFYRESDKVVEACTESEFLIV